MQSPTLLLLISLVAGTFANAQLKKGTRMPGATIASGVFTSGTTSYGQSYTTDNNNYSFTLAPSYGKFVRNNLVAGVSLLFSTAGQKTNNVSSADTIFSSNKYNTTDIGLGVYLRHYLASGNTVQPFVHLYLNGGTGLGSNSGYVFGTDGLGAYKDTYSGDTRGRAFVNTGVNLGITKMLNATIGIDAFAGYVFSYSKSETETENTRTYTPSGSLNTTFKSAQKFTGHGLSIGVGIQAFL